MRSGWIRPCKWTGSLVRSLSQVMFLLVIFWFCLKFSEGHTVRHSLCNIKPLSVMKCFRFGGVERKMFKSRTWGKGPPRIRYKIHFPWRLPSPIDHGLMWRFNIACSVEWMYGCHPTYRDIIQVGFTMINRCGSKGVQALQGSGPLLRTICDFSNYRGVIWEGVI